MIQQSLIRQFDVHQLLVHRLPVVSLVRSTIACSPIAIASPIVPAQVLHFAYLYSSKALRAEFCAALRSLPCKQVLLSLVRNLLGETRVLLSNVPTKSPCLHLHGVPQRLSSVKSHVPEVPAKRLLPQWLCSDQERSGPYHVSPLDSRDMQTHNRRSVPERTSLVLQN